MFKIILLLLITCTINFVSSDIYSASQHNKTQVKNVLPKKATLIIDCSDTKKKPTVLYQQSANEIRHPASLTKIMTVYLLLEAIQNKRVTFNTKFKVSKFASQQMPSKLNLKPGETISVLDCIKALLVKSANDVAVVVAEGLAGSVSAFCKLMNEKAKSLGMKSTHYENPSGVPNKKQVTCANDIAILGLSLINRFPQYWYLFSIKNFTYKNKTYNTHCKILRWYNGSDGAKTGYICASGFNLWVTATKYNKEGKSKRLFAIIFGERSGKERDFKAARLLDSYFGEYKIVNNIKSNNKISKYNKIDNINNNKSNNQIAPTRSKPEKVKDNISAIKSQTVKNSDSKDSINNDEIIYELESFPMEDIIKSSGKSKEYFDDLYKDDVPLQVTSSTPIDFTKQNNKKKKINNKNKLLVKNNRKASNKKKIKSNNTISQKQK